MSCVRSDVAEGSNMKDSERIWRNFLFYSKLLLKSKWLDVCQIPGHSECLVDDWHRVLPRKADPSDFVLPPSPLEQTSKNRRRWVGIPLVPVDRGWIRKQRMRKFPEFNRFHVFLKRSLSIFMWGKPLKRRLESRPFFSWDDIEWGLCISPTVIILQNVTMNGIWWACTSLNISKLF